jgi:hypothetical protein
MKKSYSQEYSGRRKRMKQMEAGPVLITKEGKKIDLSDFMLDNDKANKMADELAIAQAIAGGMDEKTARELMS